MEKPSGEPSEDLVPENETNTESGTQSHEQQNGTADTVEPEPEAEPSKPSDSENCNPDKMPDELKDIFLVDAIGDTLYSKRFVLQTLLNLNKVESKLSEEFEKDLCTLWDMTIEKDVIKLLLEHNVLEIFSSLIQMSEDQRLVEILLGIIGNMCSISQTREALCQQPDVMIPIIDLISCSDSLILVQLMRLFHTCLVFENSGDEYIWFQHFRCADQFVDRFAFLLSNSMSTSLLVHAYEALNAICTKFAIIEIQPEITDSSGFRDVFVKPVLVSGVIEAFKQMLPHADMPRMPTTTTTTITITTNDKSINGNGGEHSQVNNSQIIDDDIAAPTKRTQRIMNLFLDINVILSQYDTISRKCYEPFIPQLMECISKCLQPLCQPVYLLPLSSNEQILIENVNELIQTLDDPFDAKCFQKMITIWSLIDQHLLKLSKKQNEPKSEWDDDDDDDGGDDDEEEVSGIDVNMTILEYITRTSKNATQEQIEIAVKNIKQDVIESLCKALSPGSGEDDIRACINKFKDAARSLWKIEITINEEEFGPRSVSDIDDDDDVDDEGGNDTVENGKIEENFENGKNEQSNSKHEETTPVE
ncbi:uncharacterized protein LOC129576462 [Sitodiplosis mosellana]|uniref:uncharacterized protein LOC129576462 n=1 Tax=Sitodiplosis mosellana TaxID=263140 RepID=UPI00244448A6|nr:uncharacterized protein LOC129576462 [Sitodiplosis mosellana]